MAERILALDVGDRRIGVAVSDTLGITAQGVETIYSKGIEQDLARVAQLAAAYQTRVILLGDPKLLSGERGAQAAKVDIFRARLDDMGFKTLTQDERLTTVSAQRVLIDAGMRRGERKRVVDKLAATLILQTFLDSGGLSAARETTSMLYGKEVYRRMEEYSGSGMIVELVDENGKESKFNHVMTLQYEGEGYVLLSPAEPMDDMEEDEVMILRIGKDERGVDVYMSVDDEALLEKVFEKYLEIAENDEDADTYDDSDEDADDDNGEDPSADV